MNTKKITPSEANLPDDRKDFVPVNLNDPSEEMISNIVVNYTGMGAVRHTRSETMVNGQRRVTLRFFSE
jgi:hypothetical protein